MGRLKRIVIFAAFCFWLAFSGSAHANCLGDVNGDGTVTWPMLLAKSASSSATSR
jgi:hypothetical protein